MPHPLCYNEYKYKRKGEFDMPKKLEETAAEAKKTVRTAGRRAKAKVEEGVEMASEAAVASEIETKKTVRAAGRKAKAKVEEGAEKVSDAVAVAQIEVKKAAAKARRAVSESGEKAAAVAEEVKKPGRKARAAKLEIVIQSLMGGAITTEEIAAKVPKDAISAYVKVEENRIYWVNREGETGSVEIWS